MPQYLDFKAIAEAVDITQVAAHCGLMMKRTPKDLRSACPVCASNDERALQIMPETNSFRCYSAQLSGDVISLYAHLKGLGMYKAAKELQEQFESATAPSTAPQKPGGQQMPPPSASAAAGSAPPKAAQPFDPEKFAAKLVYSSEVEALGITEEDATRLGIGFCKMGSMRDRVCFPVRNLDASISGFIGYGKDGLKLPPTWLTTNVVKLKRA